MPPGDLAVTATSIVRHFPTPGGDDVLAVDRVSMHAQVGHVTVVAGPSGSGKSTLLHVLASFDRPDGGEVVLDGIDLESLSPRARRRLRRRRVGYVLPQPSDNLVDRLDVAANVALAARLRGVRVDPDDVLGAVGLSGFAGRRPPSLSGGEQQRLAFAIAAIGDPAVVLADEPTSALDHDNTHRLIEVMRRLADREMAIVVATHDPVVVAAADQVVRLDHGRRVA